MNFVKKTLLVLITPIFTFLLFATAFDMGVLRVVNQPNNVKQILADSGVYKSAVGSLLDQAKQISNDGGSGDVSLSDPAIRSAATSTFTPEFLQTNTEKVIDSVYAWLNGKTATPDFSIDLNGAKGQFATNVAQYVETRAASLPRCTAANTPSSFDGLTATCLPKGVTAAAAGAEVKGDIIDGKGFLDNPVITADSVKAGKDNQSIFNNQLKDAPKQYQKVKKTPIIFSIATLLLALAIVFLSASRRKGLRHVGVVLVVIGLFMLAFAYGLNYAVTQKAVPKITLDNAVLQTNVRTLVTDVEQKVDQNYWIFGGVYAVLGVLAITATMVGGAKGNKKNGLEGEGKTQADRIDLKEPDKATNFTADKKPSKPAATKPAAKKNIKVQ